MISEINNLNYEIGYEQVLDFGCGVGRLSGGFLKYFKKYFGVDISQAMINKAKEFSGNENSQFFVNFDDLSLFKDNSFDMVYASIVLQHIPQKKLIKFYIEEFIRVAKKGGLIVFQLPAKIPLINRIQPQRRLYAFLRKIGFSENFLYHKLKLYPIKMNFVNKKEMENFFKDIDVRILKIRKDAYAGPKIESYTYFIVKN